MIIMYYFHSRILHTTSLVSAYQNRKKIYEDQIYTHNNSESSYNLNTNKASIQVINNINHFSERNETSTENEYHLVCKKTNYINKLGYIEFLKRLRRLFINLILVFASILFMNWTLSFFYLLATCLVFIVHNYDRNISFDRNNNNNYKNEFRSNLFNKVSENAKILINHNSALHLALKFKIKWCLKNALANVKTSMRILRVRYRLKSIFSLRSTIEQCKTFLLIYFLFPYVLKSSSALAQQINLNHSSNSSNRHFDKDLRFGNSIVKLDDKAFNDYTNRSEGSKNCRPYNIDFDLRMFNHLNMHDTILGLYRSCFKDGMVEDLVNPGDSLKQESGLNCEEEYFFTTPKTKYQFILYKLFYNSKILNTDILYRIQLICGHDVDKKTKSPQLNVFDKLYLLTTYEHNLCGSIFKNSIQYDHLINDILEIKKNHDEPSIVTDTISKNLNKTSSPKITKEILFSNITLTKTTPSNTTNSNRLTSRELPKFLNNCTLILLNIYLLAYKTHCDNEGFVDSLSHYDCMSTDFSVKSNCKKCEEAYKTWLCTANIPYYENGTLIRPCQRYCFNVQNLCPFLRPIDDTYGGQPVFHCRNVIQAAEADKTHGLEDDDENYYDEDPLDDDKCYHSCDPNSKKTSIDVDLNKLFRKEVEYRQEINIDENLSYSLSLFSMNNSHISIFNAWPLLKSSAAASSSRFKQLIEINEQLKINELGTRFSQYQECIFNLPSSKANFIIINFLLHISIIIFLTVQRILN